MRASGNDATGCVDDSDCGWHIGGIAAYFAGVAMKQTLYDILGVAHDSSFEDIEIAYARRFKELRSETSWDSNRIVMLNEAREVLSDAGRRAAYDSSLAVVPARARAHSHEGEAVIATPSNAKWFILLVIVVAIAIWLATRDDTSPQPSPVTQGGEAPVASIGAGPSESAEDDMGIEVELPLAGEELPEPSDAAAVNQADEADAAALAEDAGDEAESAPDEGPAVAPAPIVGNWDCFDPVTGRTSRYAFVNDGTLTIQQSGGEKQIYAYEVAGSQVRLLNVDPPSAIAIDELSANKLILDGATQGRRIVCSR